MIQIHCRDHSARELGRRVLLDLLPWPGFGCLEVKIRRHARLADLGRTRAVGVNAMGVPDRFVVLISSDQSRREAIETLVHELVHVAQYHTGRLSADHRRWCFWPVDPDQDYWQQPWELEAYQLARDLVDQKYQNWI